MRVRSPVGHDFCRYGEALFGTASVAAPKTIPKRRRRRKILVCLERSRARLEVALCGGNGDVNAIIVMSDKARGVNVLLETRANGVSVAKRSAVPA